MALYSNQSLPPVLLLQIKQWRIFCLGICGGRHKPGTQQPDHAHGSYKQFTAEEEARIGKRAAEHGVASTVCYFNKVFSDRVVKESSVRPWRKIFAEC